MLGCAPWGAAAQDMTLVIERGETTVEVFFGLPAEGLVEVFGLPPERLEDQSGQVAFEPLRQGTWLIGDEVISTTDARIGGAEARYEAMSLMVHPEDQKLPLYDLYDGLLAIAVCSVEPPENPTLANLHAYIGYIAYPEDPNAALSFTLPKTNRGAIEVEIRDFRQGKLLIEETVTLEDGGQIALPAAPAPVNRATLGLGAFFGALTVIGALVLGLRARRSA
jgi:hypothetical protein